MATLKDGVCAVIGIVGGIVAGAFGGWNSAMTTLLVFMAIDYITGLMLAAMGLSPKTETGTLNSYVGWKGLMKKGMTLAVVFVAYRLDLAIGTEYVKDASIIAFIVNEAISIVENAGALGVPLPDVIKKAIEVLKSNTEK